MKKVLIFDFGGGTFDVSILDIQGKHSVVKATSGDTHLGGQDIDNAIVQFLINHIKNEYGVDLSKNKKAITKLRLASKDAKTLLTAVLKTDIILDSFFNDVDFDYELTRSNFEDIISPLIERCFPPLIAAL